MHKDRQSNITFTLRFLVAHHWHRHSVHIHQEVRQSLPTYFATAILGRECG